MDDALARLKNIAKTDETVLLLGETGTGKELAARAIHLESKRRNAPFIPFNCSALSRDLIESRLFGHIKGSFTGADRNHEGVIRAAEGGTLFLDEIGDLSLEAQGALLRFLQAGEIQPVGATRPINVNVRVIAATNRDLAKECEEGRFRRDLYHRLNGITLLLPPLRFRREDISVLARHFAARYSQQYGKPEPALSKSEVNLLTEYEWPGNVRELESHIKRRILFGAELIEPVLQYEAGRGISAQLWRRLSEEEKRERLIEALESNRGNVTRAAEQLGISRRTVQKICRRIEQDQT
jgi:transcriptional regulator with PAS, ATPase and Fis domain